MSKTAFDILRQLRMAGSNKNERQSLLKELKRIIAAGINPKSRNGNITLMESASWAGDIDAFNMLIAAGGSWNEAEGIKLLHKAAAFGSNKIIRRLVELGIDPRVQDKQGMTALKSAQNSPHSGNVAGVIVQLMKKAEKFNPKPNHNVKQKEVVKAAPDISKKDGPILIKQNVKTAFEKLKKKFSNDPLCQGATAGEFHQCLISAFGSNDRISLSDFCHVFLNRNNQGIMGLCMRILQMLNFKKNTKLKISGKIAIPDIYWGDIEANHSLDVSSSLVVGGNLKISGHISNCEGKAIYVMGNLTCNGIISEGPLHVGEDLQARGIELIGNDYSLRVGGKLSANILITDAHYFCARQKKIKKLISGSTRKIPKSLLSEWEAAFKM